MPIRTAIVLLCAALCTLAAAAEQSAVTEITFHRSAGLSPGPTDRTLLRADGTAFYHGSAGASRVGDYRATISHAEFERLAGILEAKGFFGLESRYPSAEGPDNARLNGNEEPSVLVTAVR